MNIIDDIKTLDRENVYGSLIALSKQCQHAWEEANKVEIPDSYKDFENVIMCGMGGSGLGARVIESVYSSSIIKPIARINDYHLPAYVNEKSLVFISSYSGNTEETVQNLNEAIEKNAKIIIIGAGGKIIDIAREKKLPHYLITPTHNPSNQPRMAIGYSIVGHLVLASKAGLLDIQLNEIENAINLMNDILSKNDIYNTKDSESLEFAHKVKDKIILLISSEHLIGATHVLNNQFNENSKNLSFDYFIPELNHHLMEGLKHPSNNSNNIIIIFMESDLYSERIRRRFQVTKDVVDKNNIQNISLKMKSNNKLTQVFELIQFGAFLNFYLSILYKINPTPIPWVDYFKEELEK